MSGNTLNTPTSHNNFIPVTVIGITLLLVLLSVVSINYTNRMVSEYSTLVETSIEVKQELSVAHLWFEEIISGDSNETIEEVWSHLDKSDRHALDLLKGEYGPIDENITVEKTSIRQDIENIRKDIAVFRMLTAERFNSVKSAGVGSVIDQKYDDVFLGIVSQVDVVAEKLKELRNRDLERFHLIQNVLILLILSAGILVSYLLYRYQKRLIISINKQIESKVRFHDIALCGGDWIWEVDVEGRYTYASDNVKDILGYSMDEIIGRTPFELMSAEESERVAGLFADIVTKQEKIADLDNWNIHKNGKSVCLRTNGVPVFDANGQVTGYRGVDKDVTEQLLMDERLAKSQKMDALGKLTGGIAHDFNNILSMIIGYSELLKHEVSDAPKSNKYVDSIIQTSDRAKKLIAKLLAFSSKEITSASRVDINQLLRDDQQMLESTLTARLNLFYELEVDLWPVLLDIGALEDAILNIAINAMHAISDTGSVTITTRNVRFDDEQAKQLNLSRGDYVYLSFSDTGIGMDKTTLHKIFDPFFTTKGDGGTGLGLSQVYGFVQQSKGAIHVSSKPCKGTKIMIYLPRCIVTESATVKQKDDSARELLLTGSETVLLVDDKAELRDLLDDVLSRNGYKVLTAEDGLKALEILETTSVDLLLSDVIMPDMDGYALAAQVKELYPSIKVQLTSGYAEMEHVSKVDEELQLKLLTKPYSLETLLRCVRELLDDV